MTRKEAHQVATVLLRQAAELADQAHALLKDARTVQCVETGAPCRQTARSIVDTLEELVKAAEEATCEDCDQRMHLCRCKWANEAITPAAVAA